jgi:N,N-dimethylformamidase
VGCPRTILGYAWPWTVRPGDTVDFRVSTFAPGPYRADLVRIVCGDSLSDPAMFKEQECAALFAGTYLGRRQDIHTGSYVEIESGPCLDTLETFTVQTMVLPTALPKATTKPLSYWPLPDPPPNQHLVSRWTESSRTGWALLIDEHNRPAFLMGDGSTSICVALATPLLPHHWFLVAASYDSVARKIRITAQPVPRAPCELSAWKSATVEEYLPETVSPVQRGPLRFGAAMMQGPSGKGRGAPVHCFNGRLDRIRLCRGVIDERDAMTIASTEIPRLLRDRIVGFWDFGRGIDTVDIYDHSDNHLIGMTVNLPTRGVSGVDWDGSSTDWRHRPEHYSAIHFHDDDLYDAEWDSDFTFRVPSDCSSGIYAARLRHEGSEDYVPFFVAPPKGVATARVALLIPTASYTAYANQRWDYKWKVRSTAVSGERTELLRDPYVSVLRNTEEADFLPKQLLERRLGKGVYLHHTDGSYCNTASPKYPNMSIKPKTQNWTLVADTYITDWLEQTGISYDVITDDLLQAEGVDVLKPYPVVMSGNHPEYASARMLDAIAEYQRLGGRWMYVGGNGYFWVTSFHSQLPGAMEVRKDAVYSGLHPPYERRHAFDGQEGGLWRNNGRAPQMLMGVGCGLIYPFEGSSGYDRLPGSYDVRAEFIFKEVRNRTFGEFGIIGGGAAGQETDEVDDQSGTPPHALHLARSQDFPWPMMGADGLTAEEFRDNVKMPRADMVFFEGPEGGAVFSVGSMAWVGALSHNRYENDVARITENVLRRFMDKTPFPMPSLTAT